MIALAASETTLIAMLIDFRRNIITQIYRKLKTTMITEKARNALIAVGEWLPPDSWLHLFAVYWIS